MKPSNDENRIWRNNEEKWLRNFINRTCFILFYFQGSRKCRAGIITNVINGQTTIVKVKGLHNHPVHIQRRKPARIQDGDQKVEIPSDDEGQPLDDDYDYVLLDQDALTSE